MGIVRIAANCCPVWAIRTEEIVTETQNTKYSETLHITDSTIFREKMSRSHVCNIILF